VQFRGCRIQQGGVPVGADGFENEAGSGTTYMGNVADANTGNGIVVSGSMNVIEKNALLGSGLIELVDQFSTCGSNTWTKNSFGTSRAVAFVRRQPGA